MTFSITLPYRLKSAPNLREHWAEKHRRIKEQRRLAIVVPKQPLPCIVTLTRIGPKRLDDDNLSGAFKGVRDGIADRLGVDDADPLIEWRYAQEKGAYGIRITIETKPPPDTGEHPGA